MGDKGMGYLQIIIWGLIYETIEEYLREVKLTDEFCFW